MEIKAPLTATHLDFLTGGSIPEKYNLQMQWQMACTGRLWCDYVSYDPRMPERMKIKIVRVPRDIALIAQIETEVQIFLSELSNKILQLTALYPEK